MNVHAVGEAAPQMVRNKLKRKVELFIAKTREHGCWPRELQLISTLQLTVYCINFNLNCKLVLYFSSLARMLFAAVPAAAGPIRRGTTLFKRPLTEIANVNEHI